VNAAESRAYQQELEALVQSRLRPGQRLLPELKSAPPVRPRPAPLSWC
jgi:hypothetical protein